MASNTSFITLAGALITNIYYLAAGHHGALSEPRPITTSFYAITSLLYATSTFALRLFRQHVI